MFPMGGCILLFTYAFLHLTKYTIDIIRSSTIMTASKIEEERLQKSIHILSAMKRIKRTDATAKSRMA